MSLGIKNGSIKLVYETVVVNVVYVIIGVIGRFSFALDVIPEEAVEGGISDEEVSAAEESQFFVEKEGLPAGW